MYALNTMKKDAKLFLRLPTDLMARVEKLSEYFHTTPSGLTRAVLEEYCRAYDSYGRMLSFPPQFAYYGSVEGKEIRWKAAEGKAGYSARKSK